MLTRARILDGFFGCRSDDSAGPIPGCGQHTEKLVTVLVRKSNIHCNVCGSPIDLETPMNRLLVKETAQNCARIGAALITPCSEF